MKSSLIAGLAAALACMSALAMPSREEIEAVRPTVAEMMDADWKAMLAKRKSASEVADAAMSCVGLAAKDAVKYILITESIRLYVKDGQYEKAAGAVEALRRNIPDLPDQEVVDLLAEPLKRIKPRNAPRLFALLDDAKKRIGDWKKVEMLKTELGRGSNDMEKRKRLADLYALLGDWPKALSEFAHLNGNVASNARMELLDEGRYVDCADFWWNYGFDRKDLSASCKAHAAELYGKALVSDGIQTVEAKRAEKRIAEAGLSVSEVVRRANVGRWNLPSGFEPPRGQKLSLPGGMKIAFCAIPPGTFQMPDQKSGSTHVVTITRPFWITRTQITAKELRALMPLKDRDDAMEKFEAVFPEYDIMAGGKAAVYEKYCAMLNERFASQLPEGYEFRLPTEAELLYAVTQGGAKNLPATWRSGWRTAGEELAAKGLTPTFGVSLRERAPVNKWGLYVGFSDKVHVLDTVTAKMNKSDRGSRASYAGAAKALAYTNGEEDPVRKGAFRVSLFSSPESNFREIWRRVTPDFVGCANVVIAPKALNVYPK